MDSDSPASRTALGAAQHRAVHQLVENGAIFTDPLALRIVGEDPGQLADRARHGDDRMRWFVCARTRYAQDVLTDAVAGGLEQLLVLGAGLDTFAYRNPYHGLRVIEVDHPATQAWKLERLAAAGIPVPDDTRYQAIDFQHNSLRELLADSIDTTRPVLCWWLGVTPYLTREAIMATLSLVGSWPTVGVVFDHASPDRPAGTRQLHQRRSARAASLGEPWVSEFTGEQVDLLLDTCGFDTVHHQDERSIIRRQLGLSPVDRPAATHLVLATRGWSQLARNPQP